MTQTTKTQNIPTNATGNAATPETILHVIYGSRTGNSKSAAQLAYDYARHLGIASEIHDMNAMNPAVITDMKNILIAVSTHGEGDPPAVAENFYNYMHSDKAKIPGEVKFSVLALGDSSYKDFCKTGHDFRNRLLQLGAKEISPLVECDIDYEENAMLWVRQSVEAFEAVLPKTITQSKKEFAFEINRVDAEDSNIFYAKVKEIKPLTNPDFPKRTLHLVLSMEKFGSDFQPGDSFGIYVNNSRLLVDKLLKHLKFDGSTTVETARGPRLLKEALVEEYEITLITPLMVKKYSELSQNGNLKTLISDKQLLDKYCETSDVLDLVSDFPGDINPQQLVDLLRRLNPRLYSVANSPDMFPGEAHFTVGLIEYQQKGRHHTGVCSTYLSDRIDEGDSVPVFLEKNEKFRIPEDDAKPVIMIATSTGIAPFRGFLQQRQSNGAIGENWLIFGDRHSKSDFLYREELENFLQSGILTRLDTAFSRDQDSKIYVRHRMKQRQKELFRWIDKKEATVYICGNKRTMGQSVKEALEEIVVSEGNLTIRQAKEYIQRMKDEKRLQMDLY
jgi:sulfite reductase (NADPH) flavoprotein alpha-component